MRVITCPDVCRTGAALVTMITAGAGMGEQLSLITAELASGCQGNVKATDAGVKEPSGPGHAAPRGRELICASDHRASPDRTPASVTPSQGSTDGRPGLPRPHRGVLRSDGAARPRSGPTVSAENAVDLVLAIALLGYLLIALLRPERF